MEQPPGQYRDLLIAAHRQLPAYAPDLNPVEGIWSVLKRGMLANQAAASYARLLQVIRHSLQKIQRRPGLLDGCLAGTGLTSCSNIRAACSRTTSRRARPSSDRPPLSGYLMIPA